MSEQKTVKAFMGASTVILISKIFGFLRETIMAAYFGTGSQADAYAAAYGTYYLPILLFGSCISSTLIPIYIERYNNDSPRTADKFASNSINIFTAIAIVIAVIMYVLADPIISLFYSGFDAATHETAVMLMRIMLYNLPFAIAAATISHVFNAKKRFMAAQLTGFPLSICSIIGAVLFARRFGIKAIGWSVAASAVMQLVIQLPIFLRDCRYTFEFSPKDPFIRQMLILGAPALLSMSCTEINNIIDKSMASNLETGAISAMNYAFRLVMFVNGIVVVPLSTVIFSQMSEKAAEGDKKGIRDMLRENIELVAAIVFPLTVIAAILSTDIIRIVFMRGAFNEDSLRLTAGVFTMYIIGETFFGLRDVMSRVFHALKDTKTPMLVALFMIIGNIILNVICIKLIGVNGLPLATTIAGIISMVLLINLLRGKIGSLGLKKSAAEIGKMLVSTAAAAAVCLVLRSFFPTRNDILFVCVRFVVVAGASVAVYIAMAWFTGCMSVKNFMSALFGKFIRKLKRS